jgi:hypothetical protein
MSSEQSLEARIAVLERAIGALGIRLSGFDPAVAQAQEEANAKAAEELDA